MSSCLYQRGSPAAHGKIFFSSLHPNLSRGPIILAAPMEPMLGNIQIASVLLLRKKTCLLMCILLSKQASNVQCRPRHWFLRSLARRYPMFELFVGFVGHAPLPVFSVHLVPRNRAARQHTSWTGGDHPLRLRSSGRRYRRRYGVNGRV